MFYRRRHSSSERKRIVGVDIARGLAILGMFVLHAIPQTERSEPYRGFLLLAGDYRPQILFAVLDGVSLGILSGRGFALGAQPNVGEIRRTERQSIAVRGVILVAIGLFLTSLGSNIVVILDYYGIYFLIALPFIYLSARRLLAIASIFLVLGPAVTEASRAVIGDPSVTGGEYIPMLIDRLASWTVVGQYPASMWLGYVFVGLALTRLILTSRATQVYAIAMSAPLAITGTAFGYYVGNDTVVGTTSILIGSTGFVVTLIMLLVMLAMRPTSYFAKIFWPISKMGSMPVTIYALHVVYFAILAEFFYVRQQSVQTFWEITLAGIIFTAVWASLGFRGPAEKVISLIATPAGNPVQAIR